MKINNVVIEDTFAEIFLMYTVRNFDYGSDETMGVRIRARNKRSW